MHADSAVSERGEVDSKAAMARDAHGVLDREAAAKMEPVPYPLDDTDMQSEESFPASDPPSHWAG